MYYLEQGACCNHLYDAKAIEISVIYRLFYPAEELARFFYPVLYKDLAFDTLVRRNYEHAKTVQELANLCGYSLPNFKKLFTKHFDVPPYRWMLQQKSAKIKNRLLDKTVPIKAIAALNVTVSKFAHDANTPYCKSVTCAGIVTPTNRINKSREYSILQE